MLPALDSAASFAGGSGGAADATARHGAAARGPEVGGPRRRSSTRRCGPLWSLPAPKLSDQCVGREPLFP